MQTIQSQQAPSSSKPSRTGWELRNALVDLLTALRAAPDNPVSLLRVGNPLLQQGFEIAQVQDILRQMGEEGMIEFLPGNRLRLLEKNG